MSIDIVPAQPDDLERMHRVDGAVFGITYGAADIEANAEVLDLSRFRLAVDQGDLVGMAGSYALEITLPGGALVPMTALTWVSVVVTHRRRGLMRRLIDAIHADGVERGEPLGALTASEGGIYDRFGYGVATTIPLTTIDRRRAQVRPEFHPAPGTVRLVAPADAVAAMVERYDRYRRRQVGEVSRSEPWHRQRIHGWGDGAVVALHDDGYIAWSVAPDWNSGFPSHSLKVHDIVAATDEAHAALWATALSVDLVGPVHAIGLVAPDDGLRHVLDDPRALRTTAWNDHVWLRPVDIAECFGSRSYRVDDRIVLGIDGAAWEVSADGCRRSDLPVDLDLTPPAVGPLLLGGVSASELARGRRLTPSSDAVLGRADAFFGWDPLPHCRTAF